MRKYIYILFLLTISTIALGQRSSNKTIKNLKVVNKSKLIQDVTIGSSSFDGSAILTVTSTTQGALMPRMNTAARDAISSPTDGLLIFNTTTNQYEFFETTWQAVGGDGDGGIYEASGSLSNNPTIITQAANKLQFTSSIVDGFSIDGTTFSVDASNNRIGIGTATPSNKLTIKVTGNDQGVDIKDASGAIHARLISDEVRGGALGLRSLAGIDNVVEINAAATSFISVGNLGINTTSVAAVTLDVKALAATDAIRIIGTSNEPHSFLLSWANGGGVRINNSAGTTTIVSLNDNVSAKDFLNTGRNFGIGLTSPDAKLHVIGDMIVDSIFSIPTKIDTLASSVTTFIVQGNKMSLKGDAGANTIATITGGIDGQTLVMTFVDALITLTDDNTSTSNTINLSAAFTSTANDIIVLEYNGTSWRERTRSVN